MTMLPEHSLRVIIADDDQDDWYFADLAFKESGLDHKLDFVINGAELMERLENMHAAGGGLPDLILLDLNMPKKDGREALKEIRSDSRFSHLNVAIYSTTISDADKDYTSHLGVMRHITKPYNFSELVTTLKEVCQECLVA